MSLSFVPVGGNYIIKIKIIENFSTPPIHTHRRVVCQTPNRKPGTHGTRSHLKKINVLKQPTKTKKYDIGHYG